MKAQGFSLVELLVVLGILGLFVTMAPMAFERAMPRAGERAAVREIAGTLTAARSLAIDRNLPSAVAFDAAEKRYGIEGSTATSLADTMSFELTTSRDEVFGNSDYGRMVFYPDGTASGGKISVQGASYQAVIRVDWLTARVSVVEVE